MPTAIPNLQPEYEGMTLEELGTRMGMDMTEQVIRRTTLADIAGDIAAAADAIEDAINEGGEDAQAAIDAALARLDASKQSLEEKVEACAHMRRSRRGEIDTIRNEEARLAARRKALEAQETAWDGYIMRCLELAGRKVKTPLVSVSLRKTESLEITDESKLPSDAKYWKRVAPKPVVSELKAALKDGKLTEENGIRLIENTNLVWR